VHTLKLKVLSQVVPQVNCSLFQISCIPLFAMQLKIFFNIMQLKILIILYALHSFVGKHCFFNCILFVFVVEGIGKRC
jgi:hypothetical protein